MSMRLRGRLLALFRLVSVVFERSCGWVVDGVFFSATADGRGLVAIGCAEGVWIGFRHDSRCKSVCGIIGLD